MPVRTVHVTIAGKVQGVGYRMWVEREASRRGLHGWVRNRRDGLVEGVLSGSSDAVESMIAACRAGPPAAIVMQLETDEVLTAPGPGFKVLPTA